MQPLSQQYHPTTWAELVGQDAVKSKLDAIRQRSGTLAGRNYWISGLSGTGKSTIADLIAREIANPVCTHETIGRKLTVADVDAYRREMAVRGFPPGGRVVIVNEAHTLRRHTIEDLLDATDPRNLPGHACWIFTTTLDGQGRLFEDCDDAGPLLSRCTTINLRNRDLELAFALRAREIAQTENLDGRDLQEYVALVRRHHSNLRAVLAEIESGGML